MKTLLTSVFSGLLCLSCFAQSTVIQGKISRYPEDSEHAYVQAVIHDIIKVQNPKEEVKPDGQFELSFNLLRPQDLLFSFAMQHLTLFMAPGDTLTLNFAYDNYTGEGEILSHLNIQSPREETNRLVMYYMEGYLQEISSPDPIALEPAEAKKLILETMEAGQQFRETFIRENAVTDTTFLQWSRYIAPYRAAFQLGLHSILHPQTKGLKQDAFQPPEDFFDLLEEWPVHNPDAFSNSQYLKFLRRDFYQMEQIALRRTDTFKEATSKDVKKGVGLLAEHFAAYPDPFLRELLLTRHFDEMMNYPHFSEALLPYFDLFWEKVQNDRFRKYIFDKHQRVYDAEGVKEAVPVDLLNLGEEKQILTAIAEKHRDKVIYIDLWSTWCGPCLGEMPHYPKLARHYREEPDLQLVFLAALSPEGLWRQKLQEYKLPGEHQLLTERQLEGLKEVIDFGGFPTHLLIDRAGRLVSDRAPGVITSKFELNPVLIERIDALLEE